MSHTEGSGSVRLGPPSSRKPPDHLGTAGRCGTEFLDGFSGLGSGSRRPSRKDQFVDSAPEERSSRSRGGVEPARSSASTRRYPAPIAFSDQLFGGYRPEAGIALAYTAA